MGEAPALLVARTDQGDGSLAEGAGKMRDVVEIGFEALGGGLKLVGKAGAGKLQLEGFLGRWRGLLNRAFHSKITFFNTAWRGGKRHRVKARKILKKDDLGRSGGR